MRLISWTLQSGSEQVACIKVGRSWAEVGKVNLKSNGDETVSDESP